MKLFDLLEELTEEKKLFKVVEREKETNSPAGKLRKLSKARRTIRRKESGSKRRRKRSLEDVNGMVNTYGDDYYGAGGLGPHKKKKKKGCPCRKKRSKKK